ncbi:MAG TPA: SBBP repeat-containing protein [Rhizomicrobium sp.]|jgi:hypothetical protein
MTTSTSFLSLNSTTLLNYFSAQVQSNALQSATSAVSNSSTSSSSSGTSGSASSTSAGEPPWENFNGPTQQAHDAAVLTTTNFVNLNTATLITGSTASDKTQEDNQKLFALYQGISSLAWLSSMSQRSGMTAGQLAGFNTRFQTGMQQIQSFISTQNFNDLTLQAGQTASSVTSSANMPFAGFSYSGATVVGDANVGTALSSLSTSESFDISVTKGGTKSDVPIDLSQVQGPLTLDNVVTYVNQQLQADGFNTRFARVLTQGDINDPTTASYGIGITPAPGEAISLSSAAATPAIYVAGTTGSATGSSTTTNGTTTTTPADVQGRLVKLSALSSSPQTTFNATTDPSSGTTTAQATAVDSNGNVYVVGNATGDFGNQINQGTQDVYLSEYDSAGNLQWSKLLGSSGSASGYSLAVDPKGGVVVAGSTTGDLNSTAIADGNTDSFVARYDTSGNQVWTTQLQTLSNNQAQAVSVDASGNVYIGGQVSGLIGAGQTNAGGSDAYVGKLDSTGKVVYEKQFGTSGSDQVAATATTADGGLVVASVQNGEAFVTKYANGDATSTPEWQVDVGALQSGALSGLAVSGNQVYLSGSTSNTALNAGGAATVATPSTGSTNAFVFNITDNGTSATPNHVSYVGADGTTKGGAVTVGPDGTVYLAGTTTGTFAGQTRNVAGASNMFVSALGSDGSIDWSRQYGGADGQSSGQGIAIDAQGSSVLDALGLPRGTISVNQSVDLTQATTLRAGDSFSIKTQGTAARSTAITIEQGETLQSLADKINGEFIQGITASVTYGSGGEALKIAASPGVSANLVSGPSGFDALSRLGIPSGEITAPAKGSTTSTTTSSTGKTVFGLGLMSNMDISTTTDAGAAHASLESAMLAIQNMYRQINTPASSATAATTQSSGPAPAYLTAQIASYSQALTMLGGSSSTSA